VQNSPHITLKIQSVDQGVVSVRIRRMLPLVKLKEAYCSLQGLSKELTYLSFDGDVIKDTDTANSLLLQEGDMLDVFVKHPAEAGDGASLENNSLST